MPKIHTIDEKTGETSSQSIAPKSRKVISAFTKLLLSLSFEDMIVFLTRINIQYTLTSNVDSLNKQPRFIAKIFIQQYDDYGYKRTIREYSSIGGNSLKEAFVNVLSEFLASENIDYHDYTDMLIKK